MRNWSDCLLSVSPAAGYVSGQLNQSPKAPRQGKGLGRGPSLLLLAKLSSGSRTLQGPLRIMAETSRKNKYFVKGDWCVLICCERGNAEIRFDPC